MSALFVPAAIFAVIAIAWLGAAWSAGADPLAFLSGRKVYLMDFEGDVYVGRVRTDRNGVRWSYVYPMARTGHVVLLPDGEVAGGDSGYIKRWANEPPAKPGRQTIEERNAAILAANNPSRLKPEWPKPTRLFWT